MDIKKYYERLSQSASQKAKHLPVSDDVKDERNEIHSIHQRLKNKTLWYKSSWESMEPISVPTNRESVTYRSRVYPFHALHRCMLSTVLPKISSKDEDVVVKWCDDMVLKLVKEYKLVFNETELQHGDSRVLACNYSDLEIFDTHSSWESVLEEQNFTCRMPFFYESHPSDAFPLALCGQNDRLYHCFEFNLMLEELVLMKKVSTGQTIDFDPSLIDVQNNMDSVPVPELVGLYSIHTDKECDLSVYKDKSSTTRDMFVRDVYILEDENEVPLGKRVQLKVDGRSNCPVEDIDWGAVNVTRSEANKTVIVTRENDKTPIKNTKIESSIGVVMDTKGSFLTEYAFLKRDVEYIPGVNRWTNNVVETDIEDLRKFRPGIDMSGGKITINTFSDSKSTDKYLSFALLYHTRHFIFKTFPTTQEERLTKGATIELV